ncbi:hypothetical protein [Streptomyces sp. NBC_01373]|uniref:hypothetical protein n=1 Tax=Streptomyces sp. NBC_01373 TaxID=2903843 RepID=UPI0022573D51|nr:hypothetical protein [Streptomyces sp. NBC_01373]MCX4697056.1 hypothetical protein [Streptomyces sp. NBC_01373]MCX4707019.1 hypothetical protein [Streptomyces sp. NBC_01373]
MATVIEPRRGDDVEQALIQLDADFATIYGPDMSAWSKGVRGELMEMQRARRTTGSETRTQHARRASASRRRRHLKQLAYRVHAIVPGAVTVLLTPVWTDCAGPFERRVVITARNADGQHLKLPRGGTARLAALMQGAFPAADWNRPQTWRADSNQVTAWKAAA